MDNETFDRFLDEATHKVSEMWENNGGASMGLNEKYALNDLLTAFFGDKRDAETAA